MASMLNILLSLIKLEQLILKLENYTTWKLLAFSKNISEENIFILYQDMFNKIEYSLHLRDHSKQMSLNI